MLAWEGKAAAREGEAAARGGETEAREGEAAARLSALEVLLPAATAAPRASGIHHHHHSSLLKLSTKQVSDSGLGASGTDSSLSTPRPPP